VFPDGTRKINLPAAPAFLHKIARRRFDDPTLFCGNPLFPHRRRPAQQNRP
jgi:hypothetical protein